MIDLTEYLIGPTALACSASGAECRAVL